MLANYLNALTSDLVLGWSPWIGFGLVLDWFWIGFASLFRHLTIHGSDHFYYLFISFHANQGGIEAIQEQNLRISSTRTNKFIFEFTTILYVKSC